LALRICAFVAVWLAGSAYAEATSQPGSPASEGKTGTSAFTAAAQSALGRQLYTKACADCHGLELLGAAGPALAGQAFQGVWINGRRNVGELYDAIRTRMPRSAPGSLADESYRAIVAYILERNGYIAGPMALGDDTLENRLTPPAMTSTQGTAVDPPTADSLPRGPATVSQARGSLPGDADLLRPSHDYWLMFNRTYSGQRHSPLKQINARNVRRLQPVCMFQTGETGAFQSSPAIMGQTMYFTAGFNSYAIDARTCQQRWVHRHEGEAGFLSANRGVALYRGKVLRGTSDGHFIALDAETGEVLWDSALVDPTAGYALTGAPIAYDGRVFIGTAGADWGANGKIFALDTETGQPLWQFDVIPTGDRPGAETWGAGSELGGGSAWSSLSLDPDKRELLVSIGKPAPDFNGAMRPGSNLYTNSVVSLDDRTGKLRWYVQQIPHDTHDFDTAAAPVLYTSGGEPRMAVGSKDGLLYLYRRDTQELVARVEVSRRHNLDIPLSVEGTYHCPGYNGGVQWHGPGYFPEKDILVINSVDWCGTTKIVEDRYVRGALYLGGVQTPDAFSDARGWTRGIDAQTGRQLWARESPAPMVGATTVTGGGLVLTGGMAGDFLVLDLTSGRELYRFQTGGVVASGPATYAVDGRQYIVVGSGNNSKSSDFSKPGAGTILVFALPASQ
jgi:PQQ-dependent dehydrogenase (methanol/ethanol family)